MPKKMIVTDGLPGAGKSKWAKEFVRNNPDYVRVNYDDTRSQLFASLYSGKREHLVRDVGLLIAGHALDNNYGVVVDNTTLSPKAKARWEDFAKQKGVHLEWKHFTNVPLATCIARDRERFGTPAYVGRAPIERMALDAGLVDFGPNKIVICDMDGTLADCEHRQHFLYNCMVCGKEKHETNGHEFKAWDKKHERFYAACDKDTPIEPVKQWSKNIVEWSGYCMTCFRSFGTDVYPQSGCTCTESNPVPEYKLIIVSGRPEDLCGEKTIEWLERHRIPFSNIFMRKRGDFRKDDIVKQEILNAILNKIPKEQIAFIIDDRPSVIRMWKSNGLTVYPARGAVAEF